MRAVLIFLLGVLPLCGQAPTYVYTIASQSAASISPNTQLANIDGAGANAELQNSPGYFVLEKVFAGSSGGTGLSQVKGSANSSKNRPPQPKHGGNVALALGRAELRP